MNYLLLLLCFSLKYYYIFDTVYYIILWIFYYLNLIYISFTQILIFIIITKFSLKIDILWIDSF